MKNCPNQEQNLENCNCSYDPCARTGVCCECVRYHRENNELPACFFPADIERTYDRSLRQFIKNQK
ncbi:MAG: DUF6485 family protein [Candidatus Omnitrophota bacterium]